MALNKLEEVLEKTILSIDIVKTVNITIKDIDGLIDYFQSGEFNSYMEDEVFTMLPNIFDSEEEFILHGSELETQGYNSPEVLGTIQRFIEGSRDSKLFFAYGNPCGELRYIKKENVIDSIQNVLSSKKTDEYFDLMENRHEICKELYYCLETVDLKKTHWILRDFDI